MDFALSEEQSLVAATLRRFLEKSGYDVRLAVDGEKGLGVVREGGVDLVLLDIQMPGIDGLAFMREVRKEAPGLAVLMVTAVYDRDQAAEAMRLGASDYITKPIDFNQLEVSLKAKLASI